MSAGWLILWNRSAGRFERWKVDHRGGRIGHPITGESLAVEGMTEGGIDSKIRLGWVRYRLFDRTVDDPWDMDLTDAHLAELVSWAEASLGSTYRSMVLAVVDELRRTRERLMAVEFRGGEGARGVAVGGKR